MRASKGEILIEKILSKNDVIFKEEYSFPDLVSNNGRPLRFDFCVFNDDGEVDFLIEYQGEQHYEAKPNFGGAAGLRKQQYNDMQKRIYCSKHHIPLVVVPYWEYDIISYDYLFKAAGY